MENQPKKEIDGEVQGRKDAQDTEATQAGYRAVAEALGRMIGRYLYRVRPSEPESTQESK